MQGGVVLMSCHARSVFFFFFIFPLLTEMEDRESRSKKKVCREAPVQNREMK